jgi:hypothetical protein
MKRLLLVIACFALFAVAAKPATTAISRGDDGVFTVTIEREHQVKNQYELWVAVWCAVDGVDVSAAFQPVVWPEGTANVPSTPGADCRAYVWEFPNTHDPISNVLVFVGA